MSRTILFPDTNIFLHYPPIDQIDWCALCGSDEVQLVLCMPVLHQLDDKKNDPRRKDRAHRAIDDIARIRSGGGHVRQNVILEVMIKELRHEEFPPAFSPASGDDAIILLVQQYTRDHTSDLVKIVTEDLGMQVKCAGHGVSLLVINKSLRLADPVDELRRKLNEAERDLAQLRTRLPILTLGLSTDDETEPADHLTVQLNSIPQIDVEAEVEKARKLYPVQNPPLPVSVPEATPRPIDLLATSRMFVGISPDEYKRYNTEVERFFTAYPTYLGAMNKYRQVKSRAFQFDVWLSNDGSCPADEISMHLYFPDGFDVFETGHGPREPQKPASPQPPQSFAQKFQHMDFLQTLGRSAMPYIPPAIGKPASPQIRRTNSYEVDFDWDSLKHGYRARVMRLEIVFDSAESIKSFNVQYRISAANHPEKQTGQLHFIVNPA